MIRVLFVCLGNICRSPMAEYLLKDIIDKKGLNNKFYIESAGTSSEETGNGVYPPVKALLSNMGIKCENKKARKINRNDYDNFDYIICMEKSNIISLKNILDDYDNKIFRLLDFSDNPRDISDPWYTRNFEVCYNDIMEGLNCFIKYLGY